MFGTPTSFHLGVPTQSRASQQMAPVHDLVFLTKGNLDSQKYCFDGGDPHGRSPSPQTIDGCAYNGLMSPGPGKLIGTKLSFQMNHASVCGTMMAAFVLDAIPVNAAFPNHNTQCRGLGIPGAIFQQDNEHPHAAKTVRDFCSSQHMQLLPWPAYSPDMSPIEHAWYLIDRRLARDPRLSTSKDELLLRIQAIWNSFPQAGIQNLFDSMPRRIGTLIVARVGYTKY
ncbi:transposable element Tcb2 transposase [Trichonephila clavipes]|nr:transposable element Tcb2 transposase [Trichonephila clavipes]